LWFISVLIVTILGIVGYLTNGRSLPTFAEAYPFGSANFDLSVNITAYSSSGLFGIVVLANSPQLWLSSCYLLLNSQATRIWMEHEWRSYYRRKQKTRVSDDADHIGGVRITRFLLLPYAATALLMTVSTVLHWLVSQAIYVNNGVDQFELYDNGTGIFWSPVALLITGFISFALLLVISSYYVWSFEIVMPVMAGSARVVLDACKQPLPADGIQWGDISTDEARKAGFNESVQELKTWMTYPGDKSA